MHFSVRPRLTRAFARAGGLAGLLCLAHAGLAQASCPEAPISQPFAAYGDMAPYELAPQGAFDGDIDGWDLRGGALAGGTLQGAATGVAASTPPAAQPQGPARRRRARGHRR